MPSASVAHVLKITELQGGTRGDKSGLQDSLRTRFNKQGEGGKGGTGREGIFFAAVIPRAIGNPKINIG